MFYYIHTELIEALSDPSIATTAYTIQPTAMISDSTVDFSSLSPGGLVPNIQETDVPVVTDTMYVQKTSDGGMLEILIFLSLLETVVSQFMTTFISYSYITAGIKYLCPRGIQGQVSITDILHLL